MPFLCRASYQLSNIGSVLFQLVVFCISRSGSGTTYDENGLYFTSGCHCTISMAENLELDSANIIAHQNLVPQGGTDETSIPKEYRVSPWFVIQFQSPPDQLSAIEHGFICSIAVVLCYSKPREHFQSGSLCLYYFFLTTIKCLFFSKSVICH